MVFNGSFVPGRIPFVKSRVLAERAALEGIKITGKVFRDILKPTAVILRPHQTAFFAVQ